MADEIIKGAKLIEIDKSKKYVLLLFEDIKADYVFEIKSKIDDWLASNEPFMIIYGDGVKLLEVEKDNE